MLALICGQFPLGWCIPRVVLATLGAGLRIADAKKSREFGGGVSGASESVLAQAVFFAAVVFWFWAAVCSGGGR